MTATDDAFRAAMRQHQTGDFRRAADAYRLVLRAEPGHAGAWHLLGVALHQDGDLAEAEENIRRAITLDGSKAVYHNNLGVVLRALGRLDEAEKTYRQAVALNTAYADAWANLGVVLDERGFPDEGRQALLRAVELQPTHADALYNLGNLERNLQRNEAAVAAYRQALAVRPDWAGLRNNLGGALLAMGEATESIEHFRRATQLEPGYAEAHLNLGMALAEEDRVTAATAAFSEAARLRPEKLLWRMRDAALCPTIFESEEQLDEYRAALEVRLNAYLDVPLHPTDLDEFAAETFVPPFNLAHHGRDNRRLMEKFAALFAPHLPRREPRLRPGRWRIGMIATRPHEGGFLRTMAGLVQHLDRERFQTVVFCAATALASCRQRIGRDDVEWVPLPARFSEAVQRVAESECHLLYWRKAAADPLGYLLAMTRLAPVQCTSWGTHLTSGIGTVDYYVSSGLVEAADADALYTEKLVRLDAFPSFESRPAPIPPANRAQFGLPERGHLYLCPQRLAKFHPAHDALLRQVLEADPLGRLVLIRPAGRQQIVERLQRRFQRTLGPESTRVVFVPAQPPDVFRGLLGLGHALLDLPHYGASLEAYDAFAADLPVVTWPGRLKVERYGLGFCRKLGLQETVVESADQYVAVATRIAADEDYRHDLKRRIAEAKYVLFEDRTVVAEHERFFEAAIRSSGA